MTNQVKLNLTKATKKTLLHILSEEKNNVINCYNDPAMGNVYNAITKNTQ